jgi:hypothetical protein
MKYRIETRFNEEKLSLREGWREGRAVTALLFVLTRALPAPLSPERRGHVRFRLYCARPISMAIEIREIITPRCR